jgi:uncharacterized repeat protein (TIGR03803 family)
VHAFGWAGNSAPLIEGQDGALYGIALGDGEFAQGALFRVSQDGTVATVHSFRLSEGVGPFSPLTAGDDGYLYATSQGGGEYGQGTAFRVDPSSGDLRVLHDFGGTDGSRPVAPLVQGRNGLFYGTTQYGGSRAINRDFGGTVFSVDRHGGFTSIHSFNGTDGSRPHEPLVPGPDGALYGTTFGGSGSIFRVTAHHFETLQVFDGSVGGSGPFTRPTAGPDGALYGISLSQSSRTWSFFKIGVNGKLADVRVFGWDQYLPEPRAPLVLGVDGAFYGNSTFGGDQSAGFLFRIDVLGNMTILHSFDQTDGGYPDSPLTQGPDGGFYGVSRYYGSPLFHGSIYRIDANGTFSVLHAFQNTDGSYPDGTLALRGTLLYGTVQSGGPTSLGAIYTIDSLGSFAILHGFRNSNGSRPSGLLQRSDGTFYGAASDGGPWLAGTLFQMGPQGRTTCLHAFSGTDGKGPGSLYPGIDGALYGVTSAPYTPSKFFRLDAAGSFSLVASLFGTVDSRLVPASDGSFLGTSEDGGAYPGSGRVFRVGISGQVETLHSFARTDGSRPTSLALGDGGRVFGTTYDWGAVQWNGTVFRIDTDGQFTNLHSMLPSEGANPHALVRGSDGAFYGTAGDDCTFYGVCSVFRIDADGQFSLLHVFDNPGTGPGELVEASDGAFYGTSEGGGPEGGGTIFRIAKNGTFETLHSFAWPDAVLGSLFTASDGFFYGATFGLGSGQATVFRIDRRGHFRLLHTLDYDTEGHDVHGFLQSRDGWLYGLASGGGPLGGGTIFRIPILPFGDVDGDGTVSILDVFWLVNYLFADGAAPKGPADVNGDGVVDVLDVFDLINFLFAGGAPPVVL